MRNQNQMFIGLLVIAIGAMFLIGNLFDINIGVFCWPAGLILIGAWLILRPRMVGPDTATNFTLIGDIERSGNWVPTSEEFYYFIGDIELDFTKADVVKGETPLRLFGFIGDIDISVPADVGVSVRSTAFVTSFKPVGQNEEDSFLAPLHWQSDNYKFAERKLNLEFGHFIADVKLRQL